jgi:predicted component of type VI protein secretion system
MLLIYMTINLKDYVKHVQICDESSDNGNFIEIEYSFKPNPNKAEISIKERFNKGKVKIGRCEKINNDIIIPDPNASNFHGKIRKIESESLIYEDKSDGKGTYVNGKLIIGQTTPLNIGDTLRIGYFEIKVSGHSK